LSNVVPKTTTPDGRSIPSPVRRGLPDSGVGDGVGEGDGLGDGDGDGEGDGLGEADGDAA
jgi:hypothetical protein